MYAYCVKKNYSRYKYACADSHSANWMSTTVRIHVCMRIVYFFIYFYSRYKYACADSHSANWMSTTVSETVCAYFLFTCQNR